ncbi:cytochrome c biogenesis protein ResB [Couchioplanes caeruleus]|uniref:cytochrome c biogenesis protein ResB n=1 Tax=Couchioplanes caeruleus TaxID=56438 RepID=UPI0020BEB917|nr:cytochrome c biogenesis protein ResB [Couchioplanes caeruleus]UQU67463.1 cytochrome c biogenesis protein ResB [Couchioplanes caeruleus]
MRTALMLLFLLAVAAAPGSVLPQRNLGIEKVDAYRRANPELSVWLDRFGFFDVYASPWFAAIYLLLLTSLVGCVLPRLREHVQAIRRKPPVAPRHFARLPWHAEVGVSPSPAEEAGVRVRRVLRSRRYRVAVRTGAGGEVSIAAEKGYLKETGNLLFHFAVLAVLAGVAFGYGWGWYGNRILVAGPDTGFCTGLQQFDEYGLGPRLQPEDLPGFCLELGRFEAQFLDNGQPTVFQGDLTWTAPLQGRSGRHRLEVNAPLRLDGANVYLLGHGYAPILRYTDRQGRAQTSVSPFLPIDAMVTSEGAALFPDANADIRTGARSTDAQVAFGGVYVPTVPTTGPPALSAHPAERAPGLLLTAYRGNLGLETGVPQSVYEVPRRAIDSKRLAQLPGAAKMLRPGERWTLDDGTTLEFLGTRRWIAITIRHDPGEPIVLAAIIMLMAGLVATLAVRRRRVWIRVTPTTGGCTITAAGLPRSEYAGFADEFTSLVAAAGAATDTATAPQSVDGEAATGGVEPVSAAADNVRS